MILSYRFDFKGIIDYVFYSRSHLSVMGLLGPLDPVWLKENKVAGCPHPHVPSDHFPLLVEFEMCSPGSGVQQGTGGGGMTQSTSSSLSSTGAVSNMGGSSSGSSLNGMLRR